MLSNLVFRGKNGYEDTLGNSCISKTSSVKAFAVKQLHKLAHSSIAFEYHEPLISTSNSLDAQIRLSTYASKAGSRVSMIYEILSLQLSDIIL
eukprot:2086181-Amphidinium_carterae.2